MLVYSPAYQPRMKSPEVMGPYRGELAASLHVGSASMRAEGRGAQNRLWVDDIPI